MRRGRKIREFREQQLKRRVRNLADRRKNAQDKAARVKPKRLTPDELREKRRRRARGMRYTLPVKSVLVADEKKVPSLEPIDLEFLDFNEYQYSFVRPLKVCHIIDSLGLGGAQTMMMELFNALNKYYPENVQNEFVGIWRGKFPKKLYSTYGISPHAMKADALNGFCKKNDIDIVVHHRVSQSKCLRDMLPPSVKYILINHTWHQMGRMTRFAKCDFYVSVCKFLHKRTKWYGGIHKSRRKVILNGVENEYINDIPMAELEGGFKTGRCHRMVRSKFRHESLRWMAKNVHKILPEHHHYMIGISREGKEVCGRSKFLHYLGAQIDRQKKMSHIKAFDVYFYETFQDEGASIAILEALACGVPVLCHSLGGNAELVQNGINGYIVKDREQFLGRMRYAAREPGALALLKEKTLADFNLRLHVKNTACKYMQVFEALMK